MLFIDDGRGTTDDGDKISGAKLKIIDRYYVFLFLFYDLILFFPIVNEVTNEQINKTFSCFFSPNNKNRFPIQLYRLSPILLIYVSSGYVCVYRENIEEKLK